MVSAAVILYFILFCLLAQKNFKTATGFLILLLPSYFIRFNIGPLPSTILELSFGALFLVWILKYFKQDFFELKKFYHEQKILVWLICLLLSFSTLGIFISSEPIKSLGIWRAYFLEPILFFVLLVGRRQEFKKADLIWYLSLSTASISVVAILQKIFGQPILTSLIKSDLQGRVTSFFTSPNAIGLYLAPIIPLIFFGLRNPKLKKYYVVILGLALVALGLSFSEGALVALGVAAIIVIWQLGYKKTVGAMMVFVVLVVYLVIPVRQSLLFQNRSGQNRLVLWGYTWNYLTKNPDNFIFGAGISQFFKKIQRPVNDFKKIEPLIFPHNIFLNFWSETGIFGLIFFFSIFTLSVHKSRQQFVQDKFFGSAMLLCLLIFLIHGLVDVPYFKNDLSFLWWIILAIIYI